jgi:hypothetical protein
VENHKAVNVETGDNIDCPAQRHEPNKLINLTIIMTLITKETPFFVVMLCRINCFLMAGLRIGEWRKSLQCHIHAN